MSSILSRLTPATFRSAAAWYPVRCSFPRFFSMMPLPKQPTRWVLPTPLLPAKPTVDKSKLIPLQSATFKYQRTPYNSDTSFWNTMILQVMNRNNRVVKRANKGQRPCNRRSRRKKSRAFGNSSRGRGWKLAGKKHIPSLALSTSLQIHIPQAVLHFVFVLFC